MLAPSPQGLEGLCARQRLPSTFGTVAASVCCQTKSAISHVPKDCPPRRPVDVSVVAFATIDTRHGLFTSMTRRPLGLLLEFMDSDKESELIQYRAASTVNQWQQHDPVPVNGDTTETARTASVPWSTHGITERRKPVFFCE
jgi:hypothetical protein